MEKSKHPLISVIIPVWNPGPAFSRCIESLQKQSLKELEIIIIDDCSSDDSMEIARAAASVDYRIRIIENETNSGAGFSRNRGIEAAGGDYLAFIDADDYVAEDFLGLLYVEAKNASHDIVKGSIVRKKEDGTIFPEEINLNQTIRDGLSEGYSLYCFFTYEHQSAIYRRDFLLSKHIRYGVSKRAQDNTFLLKVCSQAKSVSIIDGANYYFCERKGSSMHTADATQLQGYLQAVNEQIEYILTAIPNDKDIQSFLQGLFLNALKECWRYDCILGMKAESEKSTSKLQSELLRLPCCDDLCENTFSLRALRDYGICLPRKPYTSPWEGKKHPVRYGKLAESWTDFYLSLSDESDDCKKSVLQIYKGGFRAASDRSTTYYSTAEKKKGKLLLKEQVKRLPASLRLRIILDLRLY